jgi:gliding motility-associated-like protein
VNTLYSVQIKNDVGCTAESSVMVEVVPDYGVFVPNTFSPNNDGINDTFGVLANSPDLQIVSLKVFDRWGGQVFSAKDLSSESPITRWDGSIRGKPASEGVYVYVVNVVLKNGREQSRYGEVQLIR